MSTLIKKVIVFGLLVLFLGALLADAHVGGAWRNSPIEDLENLRAIEKEAKALLTKGLVGNIPKSLWAHEIQALTPNSVKIDQRGLWIAMEQVFVIESGLFVPVAGFAPQSGGDPAFKPLGDGVYEYYIRG